MRPIICDGCGDRIDEEWTGPMLEIEEYNGVSGDIAGDYCDECAIIVTKAVREAFNDE